MKLKAQGCTELLCGALKSKRQHDAADKAIWTDNGANLIVQKATCDIALVPVPGRQQQFRNTGAPVEL